MAEPETPDKSRAETPDKSPAETPAEKRERVMRRLGEIIRAAPPDLSASGSGPVSAGGFPILPADADEFDQETAAKLMAELGRFFDRETREAGAEDPERE